ncbi:hypothetical protein Ancab_010869 [Ancistrocladus abbreviatus]
MENAEKSQGLKRLSRLLRGWCGSPWLSQRFNEKAQQRAHKFRGPSPRPSNLTLAHVLSGPTWASQRFNGKAHQKSHKFHGPGRRPSNLTLGHALGGQFEMGPAKRTAWKPLFTAGRYGRRRSN